MTSTQHLTIVYVTLFTTPLILKTEPQILLNGTIV